LCRSTAEMCVNTEAEYAASQQKPILSLLLEAGYKPDGWLSCLCPNGDSFYDFSQAQIFDDEWRKLHDKLTQMKLTASSSDNAGSSIILSVDHKVTFGILIALLGKTRFWTCLGRDYETKYRQTCFRTFLCAAS